MTPQPDPTPSADDLHRMVEPGVPVPTEYARVITIGDRQPAAPAEHPVHVGSVLSIDGDPLHCRCSCLSEDGSRTWYGRWSIEGGNDRATVIRLLVDARAVEIIALDEHRDRYRVLLAGHEMLTPPDPIDSVLVWDGLRAATPTEAALPMWVTVYAAEVRIGAAEPEG